MTEPPAISLESRVLVADDVAWREVVGEAVILDLGGGRYFGLNDVGTRVWRGLLDGLELGQIVERLTEEFDVSAARAERDALTLVQRLADVGLVRVGSGE